MQYKIFIDGQEGTTGLKIFERFKNRNDIEILRIDDEKRKDIAERKKLINQSDFTFLCLPDVAAIEAVSLVENEHTRIIDASTAHRTNSEWAYGFPELSADFRSKIENSNRVAVPGCYASGFMSLVYPLVRKGIIDKGHQIYCHALSGYTGGGKKMIADLTNNPQEYPSPRQYALTQQHKHQKEMQFISGLESKPMFSPIVCNYPQGMVVSVPLAVNSLKKQLSLAEMHSFFKDYYKNEYFVRVMSLGGENELENGFLSAHDLADTNNMEIFICGNDEQILLASRLDNLGKGASGAAVQCMNIMMGIDEKTGLL